MNFANPSYLVLFALLPLIYYIYMSGQRKKNMSAIKFSNLSLIRRSVKPSVSVKRNRIIFVVEFMILIALIFALADPQIELMHKGEGVNVVLALDVSGSMSAMDYQPTRMEASKVSARTFIESLEPNDRAGIVIFSEGATTQSFLTPSRERTLTNLEAVSVSQGRTAIGDGLALAVDMVTSVPSKKKVVIFLSDGVNNAGVITPLEAIGFAKEQDIQVYTVGMGSNDAVILGYDWFGRPQYAEFDEATLKKIAEDTGGDYFKSVDTETLNDIYTTLSEKIERKEEPTSTMIWFIILSFALMLCDFYIRQVKYRVVS
ncbi:MAG: VWA domain-containing protein [DPANN group archaeon]|nr:VWA domain-containing protein [DPANN group archaeon]